MKKHFGFTLIELLVVIAIIGVLSSIVLGAVNTARVKAYDTKRKVEIGQIGKILGQSCYLPDAGPGEYDIADLIGELVTKRPQLSQWINQIPKDPKGNSTETLYKYVVDENNKCAIYANLQNDDEPVTLTTITTPTPGGGTGIFESTTEGWNGSTKYYQVSN